MTSTADADDYRGELDSIEGCIMWCHPGANGTIAAALRTQLVGELDALRPLRAAVLRYGAALAERSSVEDSSPHDAERHLLWYQELCDASAALDALALALAAEE